MTPGELADSIAHDLVPPPDDDASPSVYVETMHRVQIAASSARYALGLGDTIEEARQAAAEALRDNAPRR